MTRITRLQRKKRLSAGVLMKRMNLLRIIGFEPKLYRWLMTINAVQKPERCAKCGKDEMKFVNHKKVLYFRCCWNKCKQRVRAQFPSAEDVEIIYHWALNIGFTAVTQLTGISANKVARVLLRLRTAIYNECKQHPPLLGGSGHEVEVDEAETGRKKKGYLP